MKRILSLLATLLLGLSLWACGSPERPPAQEAGSTPSTTETTAPEATTAPRRTAPESLTSLLAKNGTDLQTLVDLGCRQLVTVATDRATAQINLYVLENCQWRLREELSCRGFVGRNGSSNAKREGDGATPKGLYPVTEGFYIGNAPQTGLDLFPITQDTYWVDDPDSRYYNRRVEGTRDKDWRSAEHMADYGPYYEYGFVIGYNQEAAYKAGSAIFFHVGDMATSGCVATDRAWVLAYLAALDKSCEPYILIV